MGTGTFRASHDRSQIVGIGKIVAQNQQGCFAPAFRLRENFVNGAVIPGRRLGDDPLMGVGEGHGVQLSPVHGNHDSARLLGQCRQALKPPVRLPVGNKDLINGPPAFQRLLQGVAALQLPFRFLRGRGRGTAFLVHRFIS